MNSPNYRGLDNIKPCRPLNAEEIAELTKLLMFHHEKQTGDFSDTHITEFRDTLSAGADPIAKILIGRVGFKGLKLEDIASIEMLMFLSVAELDCDNDTAHMWAYTLLLWSTEMEKAVDIIDFIERCYTNCFPTQMAKNKAWQAQKAGALKTTCWGETDDILINMSSLWIPLIDNRLTQLNKKVPEHNIEYLNK